jgi:hypothetical protein
VTDRPRARHRRGPDRAGAAGIPAGWPGRLTRHRRAEWTDTGGPNGRGTRRPMRSRRTSDVPLR